MSIRKFFAHIYDIANQNFNQLIKKIIYMKKIFVSGISGFIGTYIAIEGLKRAYQIVGTTRSQQKED